MADGDNGNKMGMERAGAGWDRDIEKQNRDWGRMETGTRKQSGNQEWDEDTGSSGQCEQGCGQGHQDQGGGTGDKRGMRTVEAGLQPGSPA